MRQNINVKKRVLSLLLVFLIVFMQGANIVLAYNSNTSSNLVKLNKEELDEWVKDIIDEIGIENSNSGTTDWWMIAELGRIDEKINEKSIEFLKGNLIDKDGNIVTVDSNTKLKDILALRASGIDPEDVYGRNLIEEYILEEDKDKRPFYYEACGLWAINSDDYKILEDKGIAAKVDKMVEDLINKYQIEKEEQLGGLFGLFERYDDTGFALLALAPFYNGQAPYSKYNKGAEKGEFVQESVDKVIEVLSEEQEDNGDFPMSSPWLGESNSNSLAMLLMGISSLDLGEKENPIWMDKFIKVEDNKENNLLTAIKRYKVPGGFKWKISDGDRPNEMATEQTFRALINYYVNKDKAGTSNVFDYRDKDKIPLGSIIKLEDKVEEAKQIDRSIYTDNSLRSLDREIKKTEKMIAESGVGFSQKDIDRQIEKLNNAIAKLITIKDDKINYIKSKIDHINKLNPEEYIEDDYKELMDVSDEAKKFLENENLSLDEIEEHVKKLDDALDKLRRKPITVKIRVEANDHTIVAPKEIEIDRVRVREIFDDLNYPQLERSTYFRPLEAILLALDEEGIDLTDRNQFYADTNGSFLTNINGLEMNSITPYFDGWMYWVNNDYANMGIRDYKIDDGDEIVLFFKENYLNTKYTWSTPEYEKVEAGDEVNLKLQYNHYNEEGPIEDAQVFLKEKESGKDIEEKPLMIDGKPVYTNRDGVAVVKFSNPGKYYLTAEKKDKEDTRLITRVYSEIDVIDRSNLKKVLNDLELINEEDYTDGSIANLNRAKEKSKQIINIKKGSREWEELTQEQIDNRLEKLEDAMKNLKEKPTIIYPIDKDDDNLDSLNTEELKNKIKLIKKIDKAKYTKETITPLIEELKEVEKFLNDLTGVSQKDIDKQLEKLTELYNNLEKVEKEFLFNDLSRHKWALKEIETLTKNNIIKGRDQYTFDPDGNITRAEFSALMVRMLDLKLNKENIKDFKDVNDNKWYYETVNIIASNDYLKGYDDGEFKPEKEISREEIATIIGRILESKSYSLDIEDNLNKFKDKHEVSNWSKPYMKLLIKENIINGYEDRTIKPKNKTTRAEAAVIVYRFLNL